MIGLRLMDLPSDLLGTRLLLAALGLAITLAGLGLGYRTWRFLAIAQPARAACLGSAPSLEASAEAAALSARRFQFVTAAGEPAEFTGRAGLRPPAAGVVPVLYDPHDPRRAVVDCLLAIHGGWLAVLAAGLLMLATAALGGA